MPAGKSYRAFVNWIFVTRCGFDCGRYEVERTRQPLHTAKPFKNKKTIKMDNKELDNRITDLELEMSNLKSSRASRTLQNEIAGLYNIANF